MITQGSILKKYIFIRNVVFPFTTLLIFSFIGHAQKDSLPDRINIVADFRFRIEQDWDSRKSDGTYREDRTRFRYRFRFGMGYQYNEWASLGMRIRTGLQNKQQDPQLTLGDGKKEFGTLPIGFEKVFFLVKNRGYSLWLGKNTYPFDKNNELFWSDNVYPEGIFASKEFEVKNRLLNSVKINAGHFVIISNGTNLDNDSYFQGLQLKTVYFNQLLELFPSFYIFRNVPDIPDGGQTHVLNYSIFHFGGSFKVTNRPVFSIEFDLYHNVEDYNDQSLIADELKDEVNGMTIGVGFKSSKADRGLFFKATYNYQQRFAAVDFLAQNDWARWDYSSQGSPDGRLTNYKGVELVAGYNFSKNFRILSKYYNVNQIIKYGPSLETGQRIRFDLDIGF